MEENYKIYMGSMQTYHQQLAQRNYVGALTYLEEAIVHCDCHFTLEFLGTLHRELSYKIKESKSFWGRLKLRY